MSTVYQTCTAVLHSNQLSKLLLPIGKRVQHLYHCQQTKVFTCRKCNSVPVNKPLNHEFTVQPLWRHERVLFWRLNIRGHPLTGIIPITHLYFRTIADVTKSICNSLISCHESWKRWAGAVLRFRMTHLRLHLSIDTNSEIHENRPRQFTRHIVVRQQHCRIRFPYRQTSRPIPTDGKVCWSSLKFLY